jgi:hypothetical protein
VLIVIGYGLIIGANFGKVVNMNKHPGFSAVQKSIASKGGYSMKSAGAILAAASRKASPSAKKANPRLNRVRNPHGIGA